MIPLHDQIPARPGVRMRLALCTAVTTGTATITLAGTSISEVPYLLAPSQNDYVHVLQDGSALLILGPSQVP